MELCSTTRLLQFVITAAAFLVPYPRAHGGPQPVADAAGVSISDPWEGINRKILHRTNFESRITNHVYATNSDSNGGGGQSAVLPGQNEIYSFSTTRERENTGGSVDAPHGVSFKFKAVRLRAVKIN